MGPRSIALVLQVGASVISVYDVISASLSGASMILDPAPDPAPVRPIQRQSQRPIQRLFPCPLPAREYSLALEAPGPMEPMPGLLLQ